jgi:poly(3-hydroxybutyrate) depolymerase
MGTADPAVPYLGGPLAAHTGEFNAGIGMSAQQTKDWWITANRADNRTSVVRVDKFPNRVWLDGCTVDAESYPAKVGDAGAAPVVFYTMRGGGHTYATTAIPAWCWLWGLGPCQGYEATWGPICVEVEALDLAYTFMSQHTLKAFP